MPKKKTHVRKHKRSQKGKRQPTIVRKHIRNVDGRARRRERFVKERTWHSKRIDLSVTDPLARHPYQEWDTDIGIETDILGVDDEFRDLSTIPTNIQFVNRRRFKQLKQKYRRSVSDIILKESEADKRRIRRYLRELKQKKDIPEVAKKLEQLNSKQEWEIIPPKQILSKEDFEKKRRFIRENVYYESVYTRDRKGLQFIQIALTKNGNFVAYNEYMMNPSFPKGQIWWSYGAVAPAHRQIGLGTSMFFSQANSIKDKLPEWEVKSVDGYPVTFHSKKKLDNLGNIQIEWEDDVLEQS